jgi:hypothetical protein
MPTGQLEGLPNQGDAVYLGMVLERNGYIDSTPLSISS